jgi:phosphoglycolate phosphatase
VKAVAPEMGEPDARRIARPADPSEEPRIGVGPVAEAAVDPWVPMRRVVTPAAFCEAVGVVHRFILWDVDGTLLTTGSAGRLALEHAAARAAGLDPATLPHVVMGGKTDPQILQEIFQAAGLSEQKIARVMGVAVREAERYLVAQVVKIQSEGRVHPGVRELLEHLSKLDGVRQSLLTGNLRPNALVKVASFALDGYLDMEVGAYGSDHADRALLVPVALGRALELRGEPYLGDEVWVIGDTRHDLACARAGGVQALLVGTGRDGVSAEDAVEADAFYENLSDVSAVLETLLGG